MPASTNPIVVLMTADATPPVMVTSGLVAAAIATARSHAAAGTSVRSEPAPRIEMLSASRTTVVDGANGVDVAGVGGAAADVGVLVLDVSGVVAAGVVAAGVVAAGTVTT